MLGYWDPFAEMQAVQNRLFAHRSRDFAPPADIYEDDNAVHVELELPGVKPDDIKIDVDDGVLTVRGERKREAEKKQDGYRRVERAYGSFSRAFRLGDMIAVDDVQASYESGVLKLTLPKQPAAKRREIAVKAA